VFPARARARARNNDLAISRRGVIKNRAARRGKSQNAVKNRSTLALSPINESSGAALHRRVSPRYERHPFPTSERSFHAEARARARAFRSAARVSADGARVTRPSIALSRSRDSRSYLGITFRDRERRERIREIEIEKGTGTTIAIGRQRFPRRHDVRRLNSSSQEKQPERSRWNSRATRTR